jgi:hypothetical protein
MSADTTPENQLIPTSRLSWTLMILAVAASIGGIFLAASSNDPVGWGGRGGAVAVAISFFLLFVRETLVEKRFIRLLKIQRLTQKLAPKQKLTDPEDIVDLLVIFLERKSAAQTRQNVTLAFVGAFATLAWGFGDIPAVALYPYFHGTPYKQGAH